MPILVVDDHLDTADLLAEILHHAFPHHPIAVGRDGADALRLAKLEPPRVVVMDLIMPVMSGVEAASEMRRLMPDRQPPMKLIAISGSQEASNTDEVRAAFDHILMKPIDMEKLISLVGSA